MDWEIYFGLGVVFVTAYSAKRFNSPQETRSLTTFKRYHAGLAVYISVQLIIYYVIARTIWNGLKVGLPTYTRFDSQWEILLSPIPVAFLLMFVIPNLPVLSKVERRFRTLLHQSIGVPSQALKLAKILYAAQVSPTEDVESQLRPILARYGLTFDKPWFVGADRLRARWWGVSIVMYQLRAWESNFKYQKFLEHTQRDFRILNRRYDQITFKIVRAIASIREIENLAVHQPNSIDNMEFLENVMECEIYDDSLRSSRIVLQTKATIIEGLAEDIDFFWKNLSGFVARGVLSCEFNEQHRARQLKAIGFDLADLPKTQFEYLTFAFFVFFSVLLITFLTVGSASTIDSVKDVLLRVTMIATVQAIALFIGGFPKLKFGFANTDIFGHRPYLFYIGAGLVAVLIAMPVTLFFRFLIWADWTFVYQDVMRTYPWLLMCFSTASVTAILVQEDVWPDKFSQMTQRILDGVVMAASMVLFMSFVLTLLDNFAPNTRPPFFVLFPGSIIGFIVGYTVPWAFRGETVSPKLSGPFFPEFFGRAKTLLRGIIYRVKLNPDRI